MRGAAIGQVIAVDHGQHDVLQRRSSESARATCSGSAHVDGAARLAGGDGAKTAAAGAGVAEEHHRRGALAPALADVGAARLFADGMQVELAKVAFSSV